MNVALYKGVVALVTLVVLAQAAYAASRGKEAGSRPYKDIHGNSYKKSETLFRDNDKNGVLNLYQKRDDSPKKKHQKQYRTNTGGNRHGSYVQENFKYWPDSYHLDR